MHNTLIYAAAFALAGMHVVVAVAASALIAIQIGVSKEIATLPVSTYVIGVMITAFPAAIIMKNLGRKKGFIIGAEVNILAAIIAIIAITQIINLTINSKFILLCTATFLIGAAQAFAIQCRFAAADEVNENQKSKAIAYVTVGGLIAAVAAPIILMITKNILNIQYAATFIALICIAAAHIAILTKLKTNQQHTKIKQNQPKPRKIKNIIAQPQTIRAILCGMISYATMNFVMTATPVAMVKIYGFSTNQAFWIIQWHIIAMFAPGFLTGNLIQKYGVNKIIKTGFILFAITATIMLVGTSFAHFAAALIILGIGWNFSFVGATDIVAKSYRETEKNKIQGINDTLVFSATACASFMSGVILSIFSWQGIAWTIIPLATATIIMLQKK